MPFTYIGPRPLKLSSQRHPFREVNVKWNHSKQNDNQGSGEAAQLVECIWEALGSIPNTEK